MLILSKYGAQGGEYCLRAGETFTFGRSNADISTGNSDTSISRKHAIVKVNRDHILICDSSSKFGTYVGEKAIETSGKNSQEDRIRKDSDARLDPGHRVRFGLLSSIYTLKSVNLVFCTSCLPTQDAKEVRQGVKLVGATFAEKYTDDVTHLVVKDGKLTIKVANALANCTPIVKPSFVKDFVDCVNSKQVLPEPKNYVPSLKEASLNANDVSLAANIKRKKVFDGITFAFATSDQLEKYRVAINFAAGQVVLKSDRKFQPRNFSKPENVLVSNQSGDASQDERWQRALDTVKSNDLNPIQESHIALAILHASCKIYCNPSHKVKLTSSQRCEAPTQVTLAPETEAMTDQSEQITLESQRVPDTFRSKATSTAGTGRSLASSSSGRNDEVDGQSNIFSASKENFSNVNKQTAAPSSSLDTNPFSLTNEPGDRISTQETGNLEIKSESMDTSFKRPSSPLEKPAKKIKVEREVLDPDDDLFTEEPASNRSTQDEDMFGFESDGISRRNARKRSGIENSAQPSRRDSNEEEDMFGFENTPASRKIAKTNNRTNEAGNSAGKANSYLTEDKKPVSTVDTTGFFGKKDVVKSESQISRIEESVVSAEEFNQSYMNIRMASLVVTTRRAPMEKTADSTVPNVKRFKKQRVAKSDGFAVVVFTGSTTPSTSVNNNESRLRSERENEADEEVGEDPFEVQFQRRRAARGRRQNDFNVEEDDEPPPRASVDQPEDDFFNFEASASKRRRRR